jgi:hypothetical protein
VLPMLLRGARDLLTGALPADPFAAARFAAHRLFMDAASRRRPSSLRPDRFFEAPATLRAAVVFPGGLPRLFGSGEPLTPRRAVRAASIAVRCCSRSEMSCCKSVNVNLSALSLN